ncbi:MAG: protein O-mannosyl-transferase family, partial [Flavobacteriales bacterium]
WMIRIAYVIGLSIGVHLMNILAIPAIAMLYYYKKYNASIKGVIYTLAISLLIIFFFQEVIISGIFEGAAMIEMVFVNTFGAPFNVGAILYFLAFFGLLIYGVYYTHQQNKPIFNTILLSFIVIWIGYSSFAIILIRSAADPPMDENNPEDLITLVSYLNREQYGSRPLLYGQYWNAPLDSDKPKRDGETVYMKGYVVKRNGIRTASFNSYAKAKNFVKKKKQQNFKE